MAPARRECARCRRASPPQLGLGSNTDYHRLELVVLDTLLVWGICRVGAGGSWFARARAHGGRTPARARQARRSGGGRGIPEFKEPRALRRRAAGLAQDRPATARLFVAVARPVSAPRIRHATFWMALALRAHLKTHALVFIFARRGLPRESITAAGGATLEPCHRGPGRHRSGRRAPRARVQRRVAATRCPLEVFFLHVADDRRRRRHGGTASFRWAFVPLRDRSIDSDELGSHQVLATPWPSQSSPSCVVCPLQNGHC